MLYFLSLLLTLPIVSPVAEQPSDPISIHSYHEDVTGDGQSDTIDLKGELFAPDGQYYQHIWADITDANNHSWTIPYGGGYEPSIQFVDLNHDNQNDIFYQSATGGSGGLYTSKLHTIENNQLIEIPLPNNQPIERKFIDDFKASITLLPGEAPIIIDLSDRKDEYIRLNIYDENGNLLEPTSLMIDPVAMFEPVNLSERNGYGLKSYQQISGAYHADGIGVVESLWYYEKGKWKLLKTTWKSDNPTEESPKENKNDNH